MSFRLRTLLVLGISGGVALSACKASVGSGVFDTGPGGTGTGVGGSASVTSTGGESTSSSNGDGGGLMFDAGPGKPDGSTAGCTAGADEDKDMDGFSIAQGDCNDCDANVNPGAIEVIAAPDADGGVPPSVDEDCDGIADNVPMPCDDNLALADGLPMNAAKAIELCQQATDTDKKWGVLGARYVRANGDTFNPGLQVGLQDSFGPNVNTQGGKRLLAISSGHARTPIQPGACGSSFCTATLGGTAPPGFPQDVPGCDGDTEINDDVGFEVKLRAPKNATGYSFNFFFYSFEYPEFVCTSWNDQFIALVKPPPAGSVNGNISFDSKSNPVSVNIAFFSVCPGCALGTTALQGTGFDTWNHAGGTSWLKTQAPVNGGNEFSIRFAIWDTGDQNYDSTTLIDNFQWIANGGTVAVVTDPIPTPK